MGVQFWEPDAFLRPEDPGPLPLIDLTQIEAHAVCLRVRVRDRPVWATLRVDRVRYLALKQMLDSKIASIGWKG